MAKKVAKKPSTSVSSNIKKRARTSENRVHIVSSGDKWAIRKEGATKASKIVTTKEQALSIAKSYVRKGSATGIVSHKKDGTFIRVR